MHYLTVISLVRQHKKLVSYNLIIWRNSTLLLKHDPNDKFLPNSHLLLSQMTPPISSLNMIILNKPED